MTAVSAIVRNKLLASMVPHLFERMRPHLQLITLKQKAILQEHNRPIEHIYFLERGVASLFARTQSDGPVAISIVGPRGFIGVAAVLGKTRSPNRCVMEVPGQALRIAVQELDRIMKEMPELRLHLLAYVHALLIQNSQVALCNVRHELLERLCRWLLLAADRFEEKVIPLTHDQLAVTMGVRRAGITAALSTLETMGAIVKTRGAIEIADRAMLEHETCECYRIITSEYRYFTCAGTYQHYVERPVPAIEKGKKPSNPNPHIMLLAP
jgi:CRP-like cAMP-binding protein